MKEKKVSKRNGGKKFCQRNFNAILFKNRVTFHCFMFDSLTKYVQHFRWISICFMIAKNVCLRYICIFPFLHVWLCFFFFACLFSRRHFISGCPQFRDITIYALNSDRKKKVQRKIYIYKYFDQIKETWKQVISNTDSYWYALFT